jgi:Tectonin domain
MSNWEKTSGLLKQISASGKDQVWGVSANDQVWRWDFDHWTQIDGGLKCVAVAADGIVWGVSANDQIWRRDGDHWTQINGGLKQISVGSKDQVWGVSANDQVWRWDFDHWTQIDGGLKCVAVAADGTVWGVDANDQIWRRDGDHWTQIDGGLKQISVGSKDQVWGVNKEDQIWRWTGNGWTQIAGSLKCVAVGTDSVVWGVNASDEVFVWTESASGLLENLSDLKLIVADQGAKTVVVSIANAPPIKAPSSIDVRSSRLVAGQQVVASNLPRSQLTVPICSTDRVLDETLFEKANDSTQKLYLPRYRIAEELVSGQPQYRISLSLLKERWHLTIHLESYPTAAIEQASHGAEILDHQVGVFLTYQWQGQQRELNFQEVTKEANGQTLKAALQLSSLEQRDQIYLSLTNAAYGASLLVQRQVRVAIGPAQSAPNITVTLYPEAVTYVSENNRSKNFSGSEFLDVAPVQGVAYVSGQNYAYLRFDLSSLPRGVSITSARFQMTSNTGFAYGGDGNQYTNLVPDDTWNESAISWDNKPAVGAQLGFWWTWYGYPVGGDKGDRTLFIDVTSQVTAKLSANSKLSLCLTSPGYWVRYYSKTVSNAAYRPQMIITYSPLYTEVKAVLDDVVDDTFFFPAQLYEYIFSDLETASKPIGLIQKSTQWQGKWYSYYQDSRTRYRFYYLPDRFEIGKRLGSENPTMSLRFESPDGSPDPDKMLVRLQYYAAPIVNSDRLKAAGEELMSRETIALPIDRSGLELVPLSAQELQLQLTLPRANSGTVIPSSDRRISLQDGIIDTLLLSMPDFQAIWEALFSTQQEKMLFTGEVAVKSTGDKLENVPFRGRLVGDPETLLNSILEANVPTTYFKYLTVKASSRTFNNSLNTNPIESILVDVGEETIELTQGQLTMQVKVQLPLLDLILRREDVGRYRFQVEIIYADGKRIHYEDQTNSEIIYVPNVSKMN